MKKFVLGCLLFCGSINVYADGEVTVYGYPYASPSNLGSFTGGSIPSGGLTSFGGMSKEAYAQMIAAQAAGEAAAKKQYCKDNNYPTSAPFCAEFKEAAKKQCMADAAIGQKVCELKAQNTYAMAINICTTLFANDNLISQCNLSATAVKDSTVLVCEINQLETVKSCPQ